ncbi:filamentous hemagglutinin family protein, partial [Fluviicoccus keumensis]
MSRHASLNRAYRLVWDAARNLWIPVAETARRRGKSGRVITLTAGLLTAAASAWALPTGGEVSAGSGAISQSGAQMTITQQSQHMAIDWQGFGIGSQESVHFVQPGASSIALNRVLGQDPTRILGNLDANGQVFILNPNGVLFAQGAQVSVGGLVASTLGMSNTDFLSGNFRFDGASAASVSNAGKITASQGGYVALLGAEVSNSGELVADGGAVNLAAGQTVTLQLDNGSLAGLTVDKGVVDALVENHGLIRANGGQVLLTAEGADALSKAVINHDGVIEARTLENRNGEIVLLGDESTGTVNVSGVLDASAPDGGNGGFIETSAAQVKVTASAQVTTHAANGKTGRWLIDPQDYVVGTGGDIDGVTLGKALDQTDVIIQSVDGKNAGNGDIFVNDAVSWTAGTALTLNAERNININASLTTSGDTAALNLNPGAGGAYFLASGVNVYLPGLNASFSVGGKAYTLIHDIDTLQTVSASGGNYALGNNIDASVTRDWNSGTGFNPIGNTDQAFGGIFEGLGNTVSALNINRVGSSHVGLFGVSSGTIQNLNLSKVTINGLSVVGALAAENRGDIHNVNVDGQIGSTSTDTITNLSDIGGLVGVNTGIIAGSASSANVTASGPAALTAFSNVGGLVGRNDGQVAYSTATGMVKVDLADGGSATAIGGLAGSNSNIINEAGLPATDVTGGAVSVSASNGRNLNKASLSDIGGLVGLNSAEMTFADAKTTYSGGAVTVSNSSASGDIGRVGGVAGENQGKISFGVNRSTLDVTGGLIQNVGGITGDNTGFIDNALSSGAVTVNTSQSSASNIGGIAGWNEQEITNSTATGLVHVVGSASSVYGVGGVAGFSGSYDTMSGGAGIVVQDSLAFGDVLVETVDASGVSEVGGLIGHNGGTLSLGGVLSEQFGGDVTIKATASEGVSTYVSNVGGVVGNDAGTTSLLGGNQVYNAGAVSVDNLSGGGSVSSVGGVVGSGTSDLSYVVGDVTVTIDSGGGAYVSSIGGVIGSNSGTVNHASGWISLLDFYGGDIANASYVGGVAGFNNGTIQDSYSTSYVRGSGYVGGLAGYNSSVGTIKDSYSSGSVSNSSYYGSPANFGGLVGENDGVIQTSYFAGTVDGTSGIASGANAGGLVGYNSATGTISDSYATGSVTGNAVVGGLIGKNSGAVINTYASNVVSGGSSVGGLIGANNSDGVQSSFYDLGQTPDDGFGYGVATNVLMQASNFSSAGWDIASQGGSSSVWRIYEGQTAPLLRHFLTSLTVTANDASKTYDGVTYSGGNGVSYSITNPSPDLLYGSVSYNGSAQGARNAGKYAISVSGLYSGQSGFDISVVDGQLVIDPKTLNVTGVSAADKTYDGTVTASVTGSLLGIISGDVVDLAATGVFADKNAGTNKEVTASYALSGADMANYVVDINSDILSATINRLKTEVVGSIADSKVYDGTTTATVHAGSLGMLISGDDVSVTGVGTFADKNAATAKSVATTYALSGADGGNYEVPDEYLSADISPLAITGIVKADNKTYDGTTAATASGTLSGVISGDDLTLSASGSFADKNAGIGKTVTLDWSLGGADAGNYTAFVSDGTTLLTDAIPTQGFTAGKQVITTANIDQLALTTTISAQDKVYDGTTSATTSGSLSGIISGDDVTFSTTGSFSDKSAGYGKTVSVGFSTSGVDAGNYAVTANTTTTAAIIQRLLSTTISAQDKVYDGTTSATTAGSLNGILSGDDVTFTTNGSFSDKNAGVGKTVNVGFTTGGADAGNYVVAANTTTTANIDQLALTTTISAQDKVYDGTTAATTSGSLSGILSGDNVTFTTNGSFSDKNAGIGKTVNVGFSTGGTDAGNYAVTANTTTTANIDQLALATTITAANKTYDGTTAATTSGSLSGILSGDNVTFSTNGSFSDKNAGVGKTVNVGFSTGGTDAGNYAVTANTTTTANIDQLALTTTISAQDKVYDGTTAATTSGSLSGILSGDNVTFTTNGSFSDKNAGIGKTVNVGFSTGGADAGNYAVTANTTTTANIDQLALTTTISTQNKVYDGTTSATTSGSLSGVLSGDNVTFATNGSFSDKNAGIGKTVNVGFTTGGADAGNYAVTANTTTTANIDQLALTTTISAKNKVYDGTTSATTSGSLSGVLSGDNVTFATNGSFSDKNAGVGKTVNVGFSTGGADAGNYAVTANTTTTANIDQLALATTITAANKTYDGTTAATTSGSLSGVLSGDNVTFSTNGSFSDKNAGVGKTVNVGFSTGGADAGNYAVTANTTTTANIDQLALATTITAANKTYDGTTAATTSGSLSGILSGDNVTFSTNGSFSDKNAGVGKTVNVGFSTGGADAGNYAVTANTTTTANIDQLALTTTISAQNKVYDGTTVATTSGSLSGILSGDNVTFTTNGSFSDKNAGVGKTVNVGFSTGGADAGNYAVTANTTTTANIDQLALTTAISAQDKVYDGTTSATTSGSLSGVLSGDNVTFSTNG